MRSLPISLAAVLAFTAGAAMADTGVAKPPHLAAIDVAADAQLPVSPDPRLADENKPPMRPFLVDENANRPGRPLIQLADENKPPMRPYLVDENANRPGRPLIQLADENKPPMRPFFV